MRLRNASQQLLALSAHMQQLQQTHSASLRLARQLARHTTKPLLFSVRWAHWGHLSLHLSFWIEVFLFRDVLLLCDISPKCPEKQWQFYFHIKIPLPGPYSMNEWLVRHTANNKIRQLCQHKCKESTGKLRLATEFLPYLQCLTPSKKAAELPAYLRVHTPGRYYFLKVKINSSCRLFLVLKLLFLLENKLVNSIC